MSGGMSSGDGGGDIQIDQSVWLTSYADLLSLLIVFFVILMSPQSIKSEGQQQSKKELDSAIEELKEEIKKKDLESKVDVEVVGNSATISLRDNLLFSPGSAAISGANQAILKQLIVPLLGTISSHSIQIEGHTDDLPINNSSFRSNWHLSSSRAIEVLDLFIVEGFPEAKLSAQGFSQFKPAVPNIDEDGSPSAENRAKNRRVVIHVQ